MVSHHYIICVCVFQVKEKETARKEYKKAIEGGHGAYLMDQDSPVCRPSTHKQTHSVSSCWFKF